MESASRALLEQVLITAGLLAPESEPGSGSNSESAPESSSTIPENAPIKLVDIGFGCGDQCMCLTRLPRSRSRSKSRPLHDDHDQDQDRDRDQETRRPLFDSYVGMTIAPSQAEFARKRMERLDWEEDEEMSNEKEQYKCTRTRTPDIHLFCADVAKPGYWSDDIQRALQQPSSSPQKGNKNELPSQNQKEETYLLALDTLYHFRPSRTPLLTHAATTLHATLLAFDLLLAPTTTPLQRLILRLICAVSGTPFTNFLTEEEYINMLMQAGYPREGIVVHDVSGSVFGGIARFIERKDEELGVFGLSVGRFRGAGRIFGWWARSGVVRGVIVAARPG